MKSRGSRARFSSYRVSGSDFVKNFQFSVSDFQTRVSASRRVSDFTIRHPLKNSYEFQILLVATFIYSLSPSNRKSEFFLESVRGLETIVDGRRRLGIKQPGKWRVKTL